MKPFYFMVVPLPLIISLNKSQSDRNTRDVANGKLSFLILIVLSNKFSTQTNLSTAINWALVAMPPSLCPPCPHLMPLKAHLRSKDP